MSDAEWSTWQSNWQNATGPLPDISARALAAGRRHRLDVVLGAIMIVVGLGVSLLLMARWGTHEAVIGSFDLIFVITVAGGFFWIERGAAAHKSNGPRDSLAFLERRIRAERLGSWFAPGAYLCLLVAITGYESWGAIRTSDRSGLALAAVILVVGCAVTMAVPLLVRRRVNAQQADVDRWRRWLDEQSL